MSEASGILRDAYLAVLGGVLAISPELYGEAMQKIANMVGRTIDEAFLEDVRKIQDELPKYEE